MLVWLAAEKKAVKILSKLLSFDSISAGARKTLEEIKRDDQRHISSLLELLRQQGLSHQEVGARDGLPESEIPDSLDEENLKRLLEELKKTKKIIGQLYQRFLEAQFKDDLALRLLETINLKESNHWLKIQTLDAECSQGETQ